MSLIVNEKRLPSTIKRLFKNSVSEIISELLQNAQRANASKIHFQINPEANTIIVRDDGSGIAPDIESWSRVLRMADSFYSNEQVEANQKPMGVGLLSIFALDAVKNVSINSRGKTVMIETDKLWESEDYWATWTDLVTDAPETVNGFELTVRYDEPEATFSYNRFAHKFEYALTKYGDGNTSAPPRGYENFLQVFLDRNRVDTSLPAECVPEEQDLIYDGFYENNRLRIGQSASPFRHYAYVVWYGQIIRLDSQIPFLLEVSQDSPVTPLAPTRSGLIKDQKLGTLQKFVEDAIFAAFATEETARKAKPAFIARLYQYYSQRAKNDLPVCVVREVVSPPDRIIESSDDFYAQGEEKVLSYREIANGKIDVFESGVSLSAIAHRNLPSYFQPTGEQSAAETAPRAVSEWTEMNAGAESFAAVLGGSIRFLVSGNCEKLPLKKLYWKPGAMTESIFARAGEFAVVAVDIDPAESDFRPVANQVFVFEYGGNFDIEEIEGLCVGLPITSESNLLDEVLEWLGVYGKACFSPSDDYDYEPQEAAFDNSISRLILDLRGDVLSTDWRISELKTVVGRIIGNNDPKTQNPVAANISQIKFRLEDGENTICVRLENGQEILLKAASHTYIN